MGSGPAGFYTAKYLLDKHKSLTVDILEALPTPFGLVRHGVAPDHPEVKAVISTFTEVAQNPRCRFFGNINVGGTASGSAGDSNSGSGRSRSSDIGSSNNNRSMDGCASTSQQLSIKELRRAYDVIVLAYGASSDANLNIAGEQLEGVMSARNFVNWYNGHPFYETCPVDLRHTKCVVIIGQGNVAIDCARILAKRPEDLASTDIAPHALKVLRESAVEEVVVVGRRGHVQASFTIKELRELSKIEGCSLHIDERELAAGRTAASEEELSENRPKQRIVDLLKNIAAAAASSSSDGERPKPTKTVKIRFLLSPTEITPSLSNPSAAGSITFTRNRLEEQAHRQRAVPAGETEQLPCELILKSVGYKSEPTVDVPFDTRTNTIPNINGRVIHSRDDPSVVPGLYVSGWLKRGPSGIIGTNITDAKETVSCILDDLPNLDRRGQGTTIDPLEILPALRSNDVVTWEKYINIDREEVRRGQTLSPQKPREKICSIDELLRVAS